MDETLTIPEPNLHEVIGRLVAGQHQLQTVIAVKDAQIARLTEELKTVYAAKKDAEQ